MTQFARSSCSHRRLRTPRSSATKSTKKPRARVARSARTPVSASSTCHRAAMVRASRVRRAAPCSTLRRPPPLIRSSAMEVNATMIKDLRERTGAGMSDCKKALTEVGGDMDKAIDYLRAKGLAKAAKKAGREATEGAVVSYIHGGGRIGEIGRAHV